MHFVKRETVEKNNYTTTAFRSRIVSERSVQELRDNLKERVTLSDSHFRCNRLKRFRLLPHFIPIVTILESDYSSYSLSFTDFGFTFSPPRGCKTVPLSCPFYSPSLRCTTTTIAYCHYQCCFIRWKVHTSIYRVIVVIVNRDFW